jgi:hypothetical protein
MSILDRLFGKQKASLPAGGLMSILDRLYGEQKANLSASDQAHLEKLINLQISYWTFRSDEKAALLRLGDAATWPQRLRLHHLLCLELAQYAQEYLRGVSEALPERERFPRQLTQQIAVSIERLCSRSSPYKPRLALVYQGPFQQNVDPRRGESRLTGPLQNASLTHIGALEVIRLNDAEPVSVDFIAYDDIHQVNLGPTTVFTVAQVLFEDGNRAEVVRIPLIYGVSWHSTSNLDINGQLTRFFHPLEMSAPLMNPGIGIGHQDFTVPSADDGTSVTMFGLGSIRAIEFPLWVGVSEEDVAEFEKHCRRRGLDPDQTRAKFYASATSGDKRTQM